MGVPNAENFSPIAGFVMEAKFSIVKKTTGPIIGGGPPPMGLGPDPIGVLCDKVD